MNDNITPEVTDELVALLRARTRVGDEKYGTPLLPFDGRNSLVDLLEELLDAAQYTMKGIMEFRAVADLLEETGHLLTALIDEELTPSRRKASYQTHIGSLFAMTDKLRADCERSLSVAPSYGQPGHTGRNYHCEHAAQGTRHRQPQGRGLLARWRAAGGGVVSAPAPAKFGQRAEKDRKGQITAGQARDKQRCECTAGVVCFGRAEGNYACGRSAWKTRFCESCQRDCRQPGTAR